VALSVNIYNRINDAREFFHIDRFPGNFFDLLERSDNYIHRYNLIVFKEDIGKLSGFIGYGFPEFTVICINFKKSIGHQNFTFAHEVGHWFMHQGINISDDDANLANYKDIEESQANSFAGELLYPNELFMNDYIHIIDQGLLNPTKRLELATNVDQLCHKYCLSFEMVLRKILFKARMLNEYTVIRKEIGKETGNISTYFDRDFYVANESLPMYQQYQYPYDYLRKRIDTLVQNNKIGNATAESILYRYGLDKN
jgi:Zn-dependent peptidase ImmA (M78 family)